MKKLIIFIFILFGIGFAQLIGEGPHTLWNGDTLRTDSLKRSQYFTIGKDYVYAGIWLKTTNPVDSTHFRVYFKMANSFADSFATPSDTLGAEIDNTIFRISDTLWHCRSIRFNSLKYGKIFLQATTGHGNRARVWTKLELIPK